MTKEQKCEALRDLNSVTREIAEASTRPIDKNASSFCDSHPPVLANHLEALARLYRLISREATSE